MANYLIDSPSGQADHTAESSFPPYASETVPRPSQESKRRWDNMCPSPCEKHYDEDEEDEEDDDNDDDESESNEEDDEELDAEMNYDQDAEVNL
ncbi:unnamed protein product [Larinioides sclopetarius]|uniref:Uncharacterized protein n=1 Tax=Larinioides sclopetarius TaxID=280406 RepID=A0AAV2AIZ7_9ARAC